MAAPFSRMSWIDFAKGLLMILVFVYHSEVIYGNGKSWSWLFEMFFLTGFLRYQAICLPQIWTKPLSKERHYRPSVE